MVKCEDCDKFLKHPYYETKEGYKEGNCLAVDGQISRSSYIKKPTEPIKCSLFRKKN